MKIEFAYLKWGTPNNWFWRVTSEHVTAAGRDSCPVAAARKLVTGIEWVQQRVAAPKNCDREFCFEPSSERIVK